MYGKPGNVKRKRSGKVANKIAKIALIVVLLAIIVALLVVIVEALWPKDPEDGGRTIKLCKTEINGDGICDESENIQKCLYDGLDCCLPDSTQFSFYCKDCACYLGNYMF
jgi:hypothetical protein